MAEVQVVKLARPAASLILSLGSNSADIHKYLTLVRRPHMSFANALVFPGGVCQDIDDKYLNSNNFHLYSKITAIRQTAEETGILILPPQLNFDRLQEFKQMYRSKAFKQIEEFISSVWSKHLNLIRPILRLVTPQIPKMQRYDCIFYILSPNVQKINLGSADSLLQLDIEVGQSKKYFWKEPKEYLEMPFKGDLEIAPPQRVIFSALERIKEMKLTASHIFNDQTLSIEPFLFQFNPKRELLIIGDKDYKVEQVIKDEPKSKTSMELLSFFFIKDVRTQVIHQKENSHLKITRKSTSFFLVRGFPA